MTKSLQFAPPISRDQRWDEAQASMPTRHGR